GHRRWPARPLSQFDSPPRDRHRRHRVLRESRHGRRRIPDRRDRDRPGAGGSALQPEADRQRELQFARHPARPGQPVQRQVRRGLPWSSLLRGLRQRRPDRGRGGPAGEGPLRRRPRLRPAALRRRCQPGRVLGDPLGPRPGSGAGAAGSRGPVEGDPRAVGDHPGGTEQPAPAGPRLLLGRAPHPRLPAQHLGPDVRDLRLRGRPGDRSAGPRAGPRAGARGPAVDPDRRVQCLPAPDRLRPPPRDRGRGRGGLHGRHGSLRRSGRRQGVLGRLRPRRPRPHRHVDHPQDPPRSPWRHRALQAGVRRVGGQGLPSDPRRSAAAGDRGQGRRLPGGQPAGVRDLCPADRRQRRRPRGRVRGGGALSRDRHLREPPAPDRRREVVQPERAPGGIGPPPGGDHPEPEQPPVRPERSLVHERPADRHPGRHDARDGHRRDARDRRDHRAGPAEHASGDDVVWQGQQGEDRRGGWDRGDSPPAGPGPDPCLPPVSRAGRRAYRVGELAGIGRASPGRL
ncbi:MAG: Serine hydroxymethyltransferase, partial [uncultured Thermomicrobiales bacterium]